MSEARTIAATPFDVEAVRRQFPILHQQVNGKPLVYMDNAATTQKPEAVIEAISNYYRHDNANVHRGVHTLADRATTAFEAARVAVARFVNSLSPEQVIWTRGTTESINLVAYSWARHNLHQGDRLLVPVMEHHSNIVPWQMAAAERGASVEPIPVTPEGEIDLDAFDALLDERVRLVAVGHVSNALGTVNPVREIATRARAAGALLLVDGAQGMAHTKVDVQALGCDFYAFSGHKMFGPTGIGALWGRRELLESMPPWQGGGEMIETVGFAGSTYQGLPYRFEAGTPDIAGAIGLGAAVAFLEGLDRQGAEQHEAALMDHILARADAFEGLVRVGKAHHIAGVFSFLLDGIHPADVGMLLDQQGIAVRTGQHCAQPIMDEYNIHGTVRASIALYNTKAEVDQLFLALEKARDMLR